MSWDKVRRAQMRWSVECEECSLKCGAWRVQCEVWSVKSAVRSVKCEVELQMWHVKQDATVAECTHARAWLAHGACKFYRWESSYISLRQLPPHLVRVLVVYTSSTAQGGGGSFRNRKPIGEVGSCESGMAERSHWLTERWLELCLLEWLQWLQWSPHPQLLDVVWCTATVVVVVA